MPAGLEIINDFGTYLIDDTHFALTLVEKGTINSISSLAFWQQTSGDPPEGSDSNLVYFLVPYVGVSPLVAVRGPAGVPVFPIKHYGDQASGQQRAAFFCVGNTARVLEYWIFDRVPVASPLPTFGLVVRNAAGLVTYHSDAKAMRIEALLTLGQATANTAFATQAARSYAVAFNAPHLGEYAPANTRGQQLGVELSPGAVQGFIRPGNWWFSTPVAQARATVAPAFLLDVTDY